MAVVSQPSGSTLEMKYYAGKDENGDNVYKTQRYTNLKVAATDEDVFSISNSLAALLEDPTIEVTRVNEELLEEE
ncbi:DUF1659 domain-containing protein [Clostridium sp. DL1XJH146]